MSSNKGIELLSMMAFVVPVKVYDCVITISSFFIPIDLNATNKAELPELVAKLYFESVMFLTSFSNKFVK